jgi:predicted 3-demethylubiquinone-9 3-methyltransferase (glyoxalase superfamily)
VSIFKNSRILNVAHYGEAGTHPAGSAMTVLLELDGQRFVALNGGPEFTCAKRSPSARRISCARHGR